MSAFRVYSQVDCTCVDLRPFCVIWKLQECVWVCVLRDSKCVTSFLPPEQLRLIELMNRISHTYTHTFLFACASCLRENMGVSVLSIVCHASLYKLDSFSSSPDPCDRTHPSICPYQMDVFLFHMAKSYRQTVHIDRQCVFPVKGTVQHVCVSSMEQESCLVLA